MKHDFPPLEQMNDDTLVPLSMAGEIFFHGHLTKSALRTEAGRGNLKLVRIANKDFVTKAAIKEMVEQCTLKIQSDHPAQSCGLTAQDVLRHRLQRNRSK